MQMDLRLKNIKKTPPKRKGKSCIIIIMRTLLDFFDYPFVRFQTLNEYIFFFAMEIQSSSRHVSICLPINLLNVITSERTQYTAILHRPHILISIEPNLMANSIWNRKMKKRKHEPLEPVTHWYCQFQPKEYNWKQQQQNNNKKEQKTRNFLLENNNETNRPIKWLP